MHYRVHHSQSNSRFLRIEISLNSRENSSLEIHLPAWRPGRYEIGNFASRIRKFKALDPDNAELNYRKLNKDSWKIDCPAQSDICIEYEYYAHELTAGSTYTGVDLLYMNPINCLMYLPERMDEEHRLELKIPNDYQIACSLRQEGKTLIAGSFHQLADAPLIASSTIEHHEFKCCGVRFHVWIKGEHQLNVEQFIKEAQAYTEEQIKLFGEFESEDYHYLFIFLPTRVHHGVEHADSTVIVMGPGEEFDKESRYHEFLAISSHELFHYWNVKRIRPAAMWPYDYSKENYSELGYVYEGVTTYYGDYMLLRSGVFSFEDYLGQFEADLQKHFDNEGRYNLSVAESSWDTWLDGYTLGVPGRKVSIYTEGMLAALMLDMEIRYATDHAHSLDSVMKALYEEFYKQGKGYTEADFKALIERFTGKSFDFFFRDFYHGKGKVEEFLHDTLHSIGCELVKQESPLIHERDYGFRLSRGKTVLVTGVLDDSPAEKQGLNIQDEIILVNGAPVTQGTDWNDLFTSGGEVLAWNTLEGNKDIVLEPDGASYYPIYTVRKMQNATEEQREFFRKWSGQGF